MFLLSILILGIVGVLSFLTGEIIGMKTGFAYSQKVKTPVEAAYTVSILNLLESNMNAEAKEMLETKLDNYIIDHWSASQCKLMGLNPFIKEKEKPELFYSTITYRKSNPSNNEIIQNHLKIIEREI
jgi:predicted Ser/Thr protein kinase